MSAQQGVWGGLVLGQRNNVCKDQEVRRNCVYLRVLSGSGPRGNQGEMRHESMVGRVQATEVLTP